MSTKRKKLSDWQIFSTLSVIVAFFFLLQNYNTPASYQVVVAYSIMSFGALLGILGIREVLGPPRTKSWTVDFDENFNVSQLIYIVGGFVSIFLISFVFLSGTVFPKNQILFVPVSGVISLTALGAPLTEILWQAFIVAWSEEMFKLNIIEALGSRLGEIPAVGIAISVWAILHAFLAFSSLLFVVPAFAAGIALYMLLRYTHNILVPVIAHALYNWTIVIIVSPLGGHVVHYLTHIFSFLVIPI